MENDVSDSDDAVDAVYDYSPHVIPTPAENTSQFENVSMTVNTTEYFYEYDYENDGIPLEEIAPVALVYGLTFFLGVIGNGLVIVTVLRIRRLINVTNVFLASLASADLLLVLICVPIKVSLRHN